MTPDYKKAAIKATETLINFGIGTAPIDPLPILKKMPGTLVFTFEEVSKKTNQDREEVLKKFGCENQDAVSTVFVHKKSLKYIVTYNRLLLSVDASRALARELGNVVLEHDGTLPEEIRNEEARAFAHHFLCPRPLISLLQSKNIKLTVDFISKITGFDSHCLSCIRQQPSVIIPAELNRKVKEQFAPYVNNLLEFQKYAQLKDNSAIADFGSYMDGYVEE